MGTELKTYIRQFLVLFCIAHLSFIAIAAEDVTPPKVEKTDPLDGTLQVFPSRYIHLWLVDSAESNMMPMGVDPDSVLLVLNDEQIPLVVQDIGNHRVWAYSQEMLHLPENTWFNAVVSAKDRLGNTMPPYEFVFQTAFLPDVNPPVIDHFSPMKNSTDNPTSCLVSCWVTDAGSGIDLETISIVVNNTPVNYTYAILDEGLELFHIPFPEFAHEEWVQVMVSAADTRGNYNEVSWSFRIEAPAPEAPRLYHPADGTLLNYQTENGRLRLIWKSLSDASCYRVRIQPAGSLVTEILDLNPDDFWMVGSLAGFNHQLSYESWYQYSCKDCVFWSVAIIDRVGGVQLSAYSSWSSIILAPPDAVVIRTPENGSSFTHFDQSPLFTWDSFNGAKGYMLGIARYDAITGLFQNIHTIDLLPSVTSLKLTDSQWKSMRSGMFVWAVLAKESDGSYSDFMNYQFTKLAPVIISQPLTFN